MTSPIPVVFLALFANAAFAASQLGPYLKVFAKDQTAASAMTHDVTTMVVSEEVPALMDALEEPPLPKFLDELKALVPTVTKHFNDSVPHPADEPSRPETMWKTAAVRFMDSVGAFPTPEMIAWMFQVLPWPDGVAEREVIRQEGIQNSKFDPAQRARQLVNARDAFRETALAVAPVLAHLNPMPPSILQELVNKVDNRSEASVAIAKGLSENKSLADSATVRNLLKRTALNKTAGSYLRSSAIMALGELAPADLPQIQELRFDDDADVRGAADANGLREDGIIDMQADAVMAKLRAAQVAKARAEKAKIK